MVITRFLTACGRSRVFLLLLWFSAAIEILKFEGWKGPMRNGSVCYFCNIGRANRGYFDGHPENRCLRQCLGFDLKLV
jgi:hypothetical protein